MSQQEEQIIICLKVSEGQPSVPCIEHPCSFCNNSVWISWLALQNMPLGCKPACIDCAAVVISPDSFSVEEFSGQRQDLYQAGFSDKEIDRVWIKARGWLLEKHYQEGTDVS